MENGLKLLPDVTSKIDGQLARRVAAGDRDAEFTLVQRYTRALVSVLTRRVKEPELVRDLAQETFIIAFERLRHEGIEDPTKLASFLRRTAINLAIGERRKQARRRTEDSSLGIAEAIDDSLSPFAAFERAELADITRRLIAELPVARDRDLLWRYYVLEHEKQTLLREYALTVEHFDRVLHRARTRLREIVDKGEYRDAHASDRKIVSEFRQVRPTRLEHSGGAGLSSAIPEAYELPTAYTEPARRELALAQLQLIATEIVESSTSPDAANFSVSEWLHLWIETSQPALGDKKPSDLLSTPDGVSQVVRFMGALQSDAYQ